LIVKQPDARRIPSDGDLATKLELVRDTMTMHAFGGDAEPHVKKYGEYLRDHREYTIRQLVTITLGLTLANEGSAPAQDVDVTAEIPERFIVAYEPETEPQEPRRGRALLAGLSALHDDRLRLELREAFRVEEPQAWTNLPDKLRWRHHIRRMMQGETHTLPLLYVRPVETYDREGFSVKFRVRAAAPPILEDVELNVRFE
jgi:hypothetical protein